MERDKRGIGVGWVVAAGLTGFILGRGSSSEPAPAPVALSAPAASKADRKEESLPTASSDHRERRPFRAAQETRDDEVASAAAAAGPTYYRNCAAARAAGAAPVRVGDPGYSRRLDRDGDGVGCE